MSNSFFRFKQFTVQQDACAMKVCTDACLFGAWVAQTITNHHPAVHHTLDIGAGTGLLSLMLAQKLTGTMIDAVEMDEAAAQQANKNFETAPWKERMHIYPMALQDFTAANVYDLIISNPPFFENDLKSNDSKRNLALHSDALSLEELVGFAAKNIDNNGLFGVLLPYHRTNAFEKIAASQGFFIKEKLLVRQTREHAYFRTMLLLSRKQSETAVSEITILDSTNQYTAAFTALLNDYYLYL